MNLKQIEERKFLIKKIIPPKNGDYSLNGCDDPKKFLELPFYKQNQLVNWILEKLEPSKGFNYNRSSYGLKHYFSDDVGGFYIKNGAFKGAMLIAGFKVANEEYQNWNFNIKQKSITNLNKWRS